MVLGGLASLLPLPLGSRPAWFLAGCPSLIPLPLGRRPSWFLAEVFLYWYKFKFYWGLNLPTQHFALCLRPNGM